MNSLERLYLQRGCPDGDLEGCCAVSEWAAQEIERLSAEVQRLSPGRQQGLREFVDDLINSIHHSITEKLPDVPAHWNGRQLRMYITDMFAERCDAKRYASQKDVENYQNDRRTCNL